MDPEPPQPRFRLPVWALPVGGFSGCAAAGALWGQAGGIAAVALLAVVGVSVLVADFMQDTRGRHLAQVTALLAAVLVLGIAAVRGVDLIPFTGGSRSPVDLRGRILTTADLTGLDLRSAQLQGARLSGVSLSGVDLSGADLSAAVVDGANLAGANLDRVHARATSFHAACLRGTTWRTAEVAGADFSGADATGALLDPAVVASAKVAPPANALGAPCSG